MTDTVRLCAVVPTHNHYSALGDVIATLRQHDLAIIIVDDGSSPDIATNIAALHDPDHQVTVHRLDENGGKGIAVMTALAIAERHGFTHALQVDADGQHDLGKLPAMIQSAHNHPDALITGKPVYDESIPTGRKIGRWVTHVWVWIETLSLAIRDSMCGFRVYPIAPSLAVWRDEGCGHKMDFDTEIMVRLFWRGVPVIEIPTDVTYPAGNISNFRVWEDNVLISWMHTRLVFGMIARLPCFLLAGAKWQDQTKPSTTTTQDQNPQSKSAQGVSPSNNARASRHWADIDERGIYWGMRFLGAVYRYGGRGLCLAVMFPIILYFFLTGDQARKASHDFLRRVARINHAPMPGWFDSFKHFLAFGQSALDKIAAWCGEHKMDDVDLPAGHNSLFSYIPKNQAAVLLVSHFGNIEMIRAMATRERDFRVNVLLHQKNAARFGRVMQKLAPESQVNLIEVTEIGPDTAMLLQDKVAQGEWVVIAADRVAIGARDKTVSVPFLGDDARFPQGPFILAYLLGCPVYMAAAWRKGNRFAVDWQKLTDKMELPRKGRTDHIAAYARQYADWLAKLALAHPRQWFNFYDFWAPRKDQNDKDR